MMVCVCVCVQLVNSAAANAGLSHAQQQFQDVLNKQMEKVGKHFHTSLPLRRTSLLLDFNLVIWFMLLKQNITVHWRVT